MVSYSAQRSVPAKKHCWMVLLLVSTIFLTSIALIGIQGDFPLNDDWANATTVQNFVTSHYWRPSDWSAPIMFSQSLWGASFCAISSCSFETLRISSLVAASITILLCFVLFVMAGANSTLLLLGLITVAFNPVALALSYTFMTDTFFTVMMIASLYFFLIHLKSERTAYVVIALAAAVGAILCRQVGLCVPAAYAVVRLSKPSQETLLKRLSSAGFPLFICGMVYLGFREWMQLTGRQPQNYNLPVQLIADQVHDILSLFTHVSTNISTMLLYMGLFLSLILLVTKLTEGAAGSRGRTASIGISLASVAFSICRMFRLGIVMPIDFNVLVPEGIGPLHLRDTDILLQPDVARLPIEFWIAVTVVSLLGQFLLAQRILDYLIGVSSRRRTLMLDPRDVQPLMALLTALIYCVPVILIPIWDRYFVPLVPVLVYWLLVTGRLAWTTVLAPALSTIACTSLVLYSILGVHDYMAWNRARWQALTTLEQSGAANYHTVDGGFEYNGLRGYDTQYKPPIAKSWWWVQDDPYIISFGPITGYEPIGHYQYVNYLLPGLRTVYLLRRVTKTAP